MAYSCWCNPEPEFRDISKKIKPTQGPLLAYDPMIMDLLMASTGKRVLSPEGNTSVGFLDSPEAIRTIQWLNAYYHNDMTKINPMSWK
jgi:multiple sugar transport system substrate-binding protein